MPISSDAPSARAVLFLLLSVTIAAGGCSRTKYRLQADRDAYGVIAERNVDPRWCANDYSVEIDPRSRYFDAYDPDHSPMPSDDPGSHQYMRCVDGMKGWKHWHDNGDRIELENPAWREALAEYVEIGQDGSARLNVDSAIRLAYVHSPSHQQQLETLYLSALDVTAERFRLDSQFFGGYDARFAHNGSLIPAGLSYSPLLKRFVITPPLEGAGVENNRLTVGRPFGADPALQARRQLATAGELLVGFANSFVFEFTGGDANLASSLANFSFIQPLLRGAGKDIALEQLTLKERTLLANLRAYGQYRQGFYTQVAIGELGVTGPQRGGAGTTLQSFSGTGGVGGYLGLLQQRQQIRNTEDNLSLQNRTLARLEALLANDLIDLVQVDQFRQSVKAEEANLLLRDNTIELALDRFKTGTLGLPPDLSIELDDGLIRQFQLVPREATAIQDSIVEVQVRVGKTAELLDLAAKIAELQDRVGELPNDAEVESIRKFLGDVFRLVQTVRRQLDDVQTDLARMEEAGPAREQPMTDVERQLLQLVREKLREGPADLDQQFADAKAKLEILRDGLSEETKDATVSENVVWLRDLLRLPQGCILVQAFAHRLEAEPIQVLADAFQLVEPVRHLFDAAREDLAHMEEVVPTRELMMDEDERIEFQLDREQLAKMFAELEEDFAVAAAEIASLRGGLSERSRRATARRLVSWVANYLRLVERLALVPARARLEAVTIDSIELDSDYALQVALANRLDFMNGRAALVDRWRSIQISADSLQSVLNVTASGDVRTARNNPISFRAPTGSLRLGLEFDAPFTRLLERNVYRESLIEYQRSRRGLIQSRDSLHLGLRALIRQIEQLRQNLEIQRGAVVIAIRRVDQTQLSLSPPRHAPQPGTRPPINPTTAINLLSAQTSLRDTQNNFLNAWLSYYAARMRLYRELGVMQLDPEGRWIEYPIGGPDNNVPHAVPQDAPARIDDPGPEPLPLPPAVPAGWVDLAGYVQQRPGSPPMAEVQHAGYFEAVRPDQIRRLPPITNSSGTNGYNGPQDRNGTPPGYITE